VTGPVPMAYHKPQMRVRRTSDLFPIPSSRRRPGSSRQGGYILIPVVMAIALVATIAFMINYEGAIEANISGGELESDRVRYVAEAGLQHALWRTGRQGCGPYTDITAAPLHSHSYTTGLTTDLSSTTDYPISVDQDTWIRSDWPTENKATDTELHIRFEGGTIERPMYRYDLSSLPANASILSARAWFYVSKEHPEGPVDIHLLTEDWTDASATWDSMGDKMDNAVLATIPTQPAEDVWVSVNLTAQVQAWVNGQPNYGITLNSTSEGTHGDYASREAGQQPYLEVVVGTSPSSPAILQSVGTLANGVSRTIIRNDVILYQQPSGLVEWQHDGTQAIDAYIWETHSTTNYGNDYEIWVSRGTNNTSLSLFRFNLQAIPAGAKIRSATLSLLHESGNDADVPVTAHRITNPWNEDYVTWRRRDNGINWDTSGGDLDPNAVSTTLVGPASNIRYEWDLTSLVQGWVDATYENHGVALRTMENGIFGERFYTSDETDPARRPRLTITYACECGQACLAPQGAGNILMVVSNEYDMKAGEKLKRSALERWGYSVTLVSQWDVSWSFDAKAATSDLVYVSNAVDSNTWGMAPKLAATALPVINEEGALNDELGIASGSGTPVGSSIQLVDTSHYITQLFPAGQLQFKTHEMHLTTAAGSLAPEALELARVGGDAALVVLESGAALAGGGNAAGRRVLLPVGDGDYDWQLTSSGQLIVQRALAWGMGTPEPVLAGHWKLDDETGLTATDSSGRGNDGTLTGGPAWTGGKLAGALALDGSNDRVLVPDDPTLDITGAITLAAWIKPKLTGTQYVIRKAQFDSTDGYELSLSATGKVFFRLNQRTQANTYRIDSLTSYPSDGSTWMHIAATSDGENQRLYINGVEEASQPATISINPNNTDLSLGGQVDGTRVINGAIDDVRLYRGALDASAIAELAAEVPVIAPLAHWKLDENSGITAVDSEGGHHGTLVNGPTWDSGTIDGALAFDGTDDYVDLTSDAELDDVFLGGATVVAWVYAESWGENNYGRILDKSSELAGERDGWMIGLYGDKQAVSLAQGFTGGRGFWRPQDGTFPLNEWVHVAIVYDSSSDANDPTFYQNGIAQTFLVEIGPSGSIRSDADITLRMGNHAQDTSRSFDGKLDDVRIYNEVLDESEITFLAKSGGGGEGGGDPISEPGNCNGTYRDEFNATGFSGSDGTISWSTSPWAEVGESDGATSGDVRVTTDQSNYQLRIRDNDNGGEGVERVADLSGATSASLSFEYRRVGLDNVNDYVAVYTSSGGAAGPWAEITRIEGGDNDGSYQAFITDISDHISANTAIRLRSSSSMGGTDTVWFDNIQIQCSP